MRAPCRSVCSARREFVCRRRLRRNDEPESAGRGSGTLFRREQWFEARAFARVEVVGGERHLLRRGGAVDGDDYGLFGVATREGVRVFVEVEVKQRASAD